MNVFLGRVVENKYYSETGYIDVILPQTLENMGGEKLFTDELTLKQINENRILPEYEEGFNSNGISVKCRILSPIGTGAGYGMFTLPQVNSVGLVMEIEKSNSKSWGSESRYVWMGGVYGGNMYSEPLLLPAEEKSENLNSEEEYYKSDKNINQSLREDNIDTIKDSPYRNEGMFLIRIKTSKTSTNKNSDSSDEKHIHYELNPCTNEFVMKKSKTGLRFQEYNNGDVKIGIGDLTLQKDKVQLSRFTSKSGNDENRVEQIQVFDDEKVKLQFLNKEKNIDRSLIFDDDKIELTFNNGDKNKKVFMKFDKEGNINIESSGDCKVNIGGAIDIKNDIGCEIKMNKKISIKNEFGNLFLLLNNLYNKLLTLHTEGTQVSQSGTAWAQEFVPMDQSTLRGLMDDGEEE